MDKEKQEVEHEEEVSSVGREQSEEKGSACRRGLVLERSRRKRRVELPYTQQERSRRKVRSRME